MTKPIEVISWNVGRLGDASKRYAVFTYLRQFQPAIIFLSETHFIKDKLHLLHKPWIGHCYHSTFSSLARGVSVLVHKQIPFTCTTSLMDQEGGYVCLICTIHNVPLILIALYIPYSGEVLRKVLSFIDASPSAPVLLTHTGTNFHHPYWHKLVGGGEALSSRTWRQTRSGHIFQI